MKLLVILLGLLFITTTAFADVTAKVINYEKEINSNGTPIIKVTTEYKLDGKKVESNYPDGNWRTRYSAENYSQTKVLEDIKVHCESITRYYIVNNRQAITDKQNVIVDNILTQPLPNIEYSLKNLYIKDLDLTIDAKGVISREIDR